MKKQAQGKIVLVVDGGGRGSALVERYAQSKQVRRLIAVPGNDLMKLTTPKPVTIYPSLTTTSVKEIVGIAKQERVDLVDVAQDNAIEIGLVDALIKNGIPTVGPTRAAGRIEWDKAWAREFGERWGIKQPEFKVCRNQAEGARYIRAQPDQSWFIKAAGLAEGKGALAAKNNQEALRRIAEMARFKEAGAVYLIEKWLTGDDGAAGEEFSLFVLSDGERYQIIGSAQDHKRVNDGDAGENTGGMGCSTPPLLLTPKLTRIIKKEIVEKVIRGLRAEGRPYTGVLYVGGMVIQEKGELVPYVIEFNARWGDPEVQVVLPGLKNDLFDLSMAMARGDIRGLKLDMDHQARVVVAGASKGYPIDYAAVKGKEIYGLNELLKLDGVKLYGAGIKEVNGHYYAQGGRLFYIVGIGATVVAARERAYGAMSRISIEGNNLHYRTDIGWRDVQRLRR